MRLGRTGAGRVVVGGVLDGGVVVGKGLGRWLAGERGAIGLGCSWMVRRDDDENGVRRVEGPRYLSQVARFPQCHCFSTE